MCTLFYRLLLIIIKPRRSSIAPAYWFGRLPVEFGRRSVRVVAIVNSGKQQQTRSFGMVGRVGPKSHVLDGAQIPTVRGTFLRKFGSAM